MDRWTLRQRIAAAIHRLAFRVAKPECHEYRVYVDGAEVFSVAFEGGFVASGPPPDSGVTTRLFCDDEEVLFGE